MRRAPWLFLVLFGVLQECQAQAAVCGEAVTLETRPGSTTRYSFLAPREAAAAPPTLVMLIGGGGHISLDDQGCPQKLNGNSLVRMGPLLQAAGIATVLVDAPSDHRGEDGLGGFRMAAQHAEDLGKVIAGIRQRTRGAVWLVGHSRGTISAANAAARLDGAAAPDGVILLSAMMVGDSRARRPWVAQTVFSADLAAITAPLLAIGHVADNCARSPASLMGDVVAKARSVRPQVVIVTGGPVAPGRAVGLTACEVREPHDFVGQETEVAAGIVRFVRGGAY